MRTTLTLDDDVAHEVQQLARKSGRTFKDVVNETLRRGLGTGERPLPKSRRFRVQPTAGGFLPGIDPTKLNQLIDEIDVERTAPLTIHDK